MDVRAALTAIDRAAGTDALSALLADWRDECGLAHLVYHAVHVPGSKPNPLLLLTYDDSWVRRYVAQDYFHIDPVVIAGRAAFLPIDWLRVDHDSSAARHFFAEAESHGVGRHGITVPIRGVAGERALFTINSRATDRQWFEWRLEHLRDLHLLAHHFHDRAVRLAGLRAEAIPRPLSPRETQCLERLAHGSTPKQIASSLDISESAVHLHLRSARHKLDAKTIEQAVMTAVRLELIRSG
jgi:LuxR family transcriptional regulator, quorum-sensing system regulator RaiR